MKRRNDKFQKSFSVNDERLTKTQCLTWTPHPLTNKMIQFINMSMFASLMVIH